MTYAVLKLTNGVKTIDFVDGVNYSLKSSGWAPAVSARDHGILGGRGYYIDVPEQIEISIFGEAGTAGAGFNQAIRDITALLDQVDAWAQGEEVDPVIMYIQIQSSDLTEPLQAIVAGKAGDVPFMSSPNSFSDLVMTYEIDGAIITFRRRGQLLSPGEIETVDYGSPSYETNPAVLTINTGLTHLDIPSPTKISLTNFVASVPMMGAGFVLVTGVSPASAYGTNFGIFDYNDMVSSEFSSVAETAQHATSGNIMRIDAAVNTSGSIAVTVSAEVVGLTVFMKVRNNHATTTWRARARSSGFAEISQRWKIIDASTLNPRAEVMGLLNAVSAFHEKIHIDFETDGSVGTLDVNIIAVLPQDGDTHYIAIKEDSYTADSFARNLVIDHRALTHKRPLAFIETAD
jgi:hypothetical protein